MRAMLAIALSLGLVGCATPRARHRMYVATAIAAIAGVGLVTTGIAIESRDSCSGDCRGNMEVMWSGGATMTFLAGSIALIQYLTKPETKPETKPSVWNYVPVPQPKPPWPPSRAPDPTSPSPPAL
jgi:hypothetical protein